MSAGQKVTDKKIVRKFAEIAFSDETKDSDRIRALGWLSAYLDKEKEQDAVLSRLDAVLADIQGSSFDTSSPQSDEEDLP